jgi:hypothetical protein
MVGRRVGSQGSAVSTSPVSSFMPYAARVAEERREDVEDFVALL